ncbi:MAG: hypothetical protein WBP45_14390, partial [Daejeonella sp.]
MILKLIKQYYFLVAYLVVSIFIVYRQATDANAISLAIQEERHLRMLAGDSEFFNPWQYRILSTYAVEYFYKIAHAVSTNITRTHAFLAFRVGQNVLILLMLHLYLIALGIRNPWLIMLGMALTGFCMATSVFKSDLSFNTYFDILFYLGAGWLIIKGKLIWLIPLTAMAALNRETSLLIPFMAIVAYVPSAIRQIPKRTFWIVAGSLVVFAVVFVAVRMHYGYQPAKGIHGMSSFTDYLKFNLTFLRLYPELAGTLTFIPVVVLLFLRRLPTVLQQWFWLICPAWFAIHLAYSTAVETRLFLVPQV